MTRWMSILPMLDIALSRAERWSTTEVPRIANFRFGIHIVCAPVGVTDSDVWYTHNTHALRVIMALDASLQQPRVMTMTLTLEEPGSSFDGVLHAATFKGQVCALELHALDRELRRRGMAPACTFAIPHNAAQDAESHVAAHLIQRAWRASAALAQRRAARATWRACATEIPLVPVVGIEFKRAKARFVQATEDLLHDPSCDDPSSVQLK